MELRVSLWKDGDVSGAHICPAKLFDYPFYLVYVIVNSSLGRVQFIMVMDARHVSHSNSIDP